MSNEHPSHLNIFAPAKVNLYLHITGRLDNGYHTLDSLISFADIGDEITISPTPNFQFDIKGPYAAHFNDKERDASPSSSNLLVRAIWGLSRLVQKTPNIHIELIKNLPLGGGIGGGSSDAAAIINGLLQYWDITHDIPKLKAFMLDLGADIPVCFEKKNTRIGGIGNILTPIPHIPKTPILLIHPGKPSITQNVFMQFDRPFKNTQQKIPNFKNITDLTTFLKATENDLTSAACQETPSIKDALQALKSQKKCTLSRMSGSGSCCFGIFEHMHDAEHAGKTIAQKNKNWWVKAAYIGT